MTRQNQIPIAPSVAPKQEDEPEGEDKTPMELALVPLFDMVNHEESPEHQITSDFKACVWPLRSPVLL